MVIDLGSDRQAPGGTRPPRRIVRRRIRVAGAAIATALLVTAGASAAPPPPELEALLTVPIKVNDDYLLTEDRLFVASSTAGGREHQLTGYDLADGRTLWTRPHPTRAQRLGLTIAGGLLLVADRYTVINSVEPSRPVHTAGLAPDTGQLRWSLPAALTVLPGEPTALVVEDVFPADSAVPAGGAAALAPSGATYHSASSGTLHSAPSIGTVARAVDLATGRVLWTSPLQARVHAAPASAGHAAGVLAITTDGWIEVWEPRTRSVRHRLEWTDGAALSVTPTDDLLLIKHSGAGVTAYSADLRQKRWRRPIPSADVSVGACGPMICQTDLAGGYQVVDPDTGSTAWRTTSQTLAGKGRRLLEFGENLEAQRVVDARSGRTLMELTGWRPTALVDVASLLLRTDAVTRRTSLGILAPGATSVRILATVPYPLLSCRASRDKIACRAVPDELRLWRYR